MNAGADPAEKPPRILLIRLSAIGDAVMASGLIPALRKQYPYAYIAWLAEPAAASLLRENHALDEVIVWQRREWAQLFRKGRWGKLISAIRELTGTLQRRDFDMVLDLQGLLKSGVMAYLTGAPERISLGGREGSHRLVNHVVDRETADTRIGSEYRKLAGLLGLNESDFRLSLPYEKATGDATELLLREAGVRSDARIVVLCPLTTRPQKHWFPRHWQALSKRLQADPAIELVVLGGPEGREQVDQWFADTPRPVHNLCGRTSLPQAVAVIDRAALVIGVDTGLTHMGIARRRPTIALFGSTRPYTSADVPEAPFRLLYRKMDCAPCGRHPTCAGAFTCMWQITPAEVWRESRLFLDQG